MTINERVKTIRKQHKLNQTEMAKKIGVSQSTISEIENGNNTPSIDTIASICQNFNDIDAYWLITGNQKSNTDKKMTFEEFKEKTDQKIANSKLSQEEIEHILGKIAEIAKIMYKKD